MNLSQKMVIYVICSPFIIFLLTFLLTKAFNLARDGWQKNDRKKKRIVFTFIAFLISLSSVNVFVHQNLTIAKLIGVLSFIIPAVICIWAFILLKLFDYAEDAWQNRNLKKQWIVCLLIALFITLKVSNWFV